MRRLRVRKTARAEVAASVVAGLSSEIARMPKNIPGYRKPSIAERLQLVEDLWDSIAEDTGADPVPPEILDEAERRVAQHRADPRSGVSWEDVKAELYRRGG